MIRLESKLSDFIQAASSDLENEFSNTQELERILSDVVMQGSLLGTAHRTTQERMTAIADYLESVITELESSGVLLE